MWPIYVIIVGTFISKLPVLDMSERWTYDDNVDMFVSKESTSFRNVKQYKNHVKAVATDKHPAQVDVYQEDVKVGTWKTTKFSTCVDAKKKNEMLVRVKQLIESVKFARETANSMEVKKVEFAEPVLEFVFGE